MNFYEQELRKIVGSRCPEATYVGRSAFVRLGEQNRAKLEFVTLGYADHYEALRATILNRQEGKVDSITLRFSELLGEKQIGPYRKAPYIWNNSGSVDWYIYRPTKKDYQTLSDAVGQYLDVFQQPIMKQRAKETPTMAEQTM